MKKSLIALIVLSIVYVGNVSAAWQPDPDSKLELSVAQAILKAKQKNPAMEQWFETAYAYAVFPKVGKGGIGIGGAHGKGLVIVGDDTVGKTSLSQVSIGLQLGGQVYSEYIMFKDEAAFVNFSRGNFEMGAQVSAVVLTAGASADASYDSGVVVFTNTKGGLMFDASVGGQKFKYKDK